MTARISVVALPAQATVPAMRFYATAFGLAKSDFGPSYVCTRSGEVDLGVQADRAEATRAPLPVLQAESLEATEAAVCTAGGRITRPVFPVPGGRRVHFTDPTGSDPAAMQRG